MKKCIGLAIALASTVGCSGGSKNGGTTPGDKTHYHWTDAGYSQAPGEDYRCFAVDVPTGGETDGQVAAIKFSYASTSGVLHHMVVVTSTDTTDADGSNRHCNLFEA